MLLKLDSFKWDLNTHQWHFAKEENKIRYWVNPYNDIMFQRLVLVAPPDLPNDYPNLETHKASLEKMAETGKGALINVEIKTIQNVEYFSTLIKFRNPDNKLAIRYVGALMFPFENSFCGLHFQCDEHGTTGVRESVVMVMFQQKYPDDWQTRWGYSEGQQGAKPMVVNSMDEYFKTIGETPLRCLPSDDEEYDAMMPEHPLSRIRGYMRQTLQSLEFEREVKKLNPFRYKPKNKFFANYGKRS